MVFHAHLYICYINTQAPSTLPCNLSKRIFFPKLSEGHVLFYYNLDCHLRRFGVQQTTQSKPNSDPYSVLLIVPIAVFEMLKSELLFGRFPLVCTRIHPRDFFKGPRKMG